MDFHDYHNNGDEYYYYPPPYTNTYNYYDLVQQPQYSTPTYSQYESIEPSWVDYQSGMSQEMNFYTHNISETQLIQYQPAPHEVGYVSSNPIMYSVTVTDSTKKVRFTLPEFDEYDPTPYGGGYDAAEYYGKPLPPSDKVCYPRDTPPPNGGVSLQGFSYDSTPRPYGRNDATPLSQKHQNGDSVIDVPEVFLEDGHAMSKEENHSSSSSSSSDDDDDDDDVDVDDDGDDDGDDDAILGDGRVEESNERQVLHVPYGSGLEAMDICESIFGYWPCLDKMNRERSQNVGGASEDSYNDQWKSAADYLFGGPFGYGDQKDGGNYAFEYGNNYNYHG